MVFAIFAIFRGNQAGAPVRQHVGFCGFGGFDHLFTTSILAFYRLAKARLRITRSAQSLGQAWPRMLALTM